MIYEEGIVASVNVQILLAPSENREELQALSD